MEEKGKEGNEEEVVVSSCAFLEILRNLESAKSWAVVPEWAVVPVAGAKMDRSRKPRCLDVKQTTDGCRCALHVTDNHTAFTSNQL